MKFQWSLVLVALGSLGLLSCTTTGGAGRTRPPSGEIRGAWVYDPRCYDPDEVVRDLKNAGLNTVFVRLSSAGAAYYPSDVLPTATGTRRDYAAEYVRAGKRHGVQVHAWHVCFMMHNAPTASVKSAIKRGEVMRTSRGKVPRPTYRVPVRTPCLESNRDLERRAMVELVSRYPLNGIQLDYIRYFSPTVDYSATSRIRFEKHLGYKIKDWPSAVVRGSLRERYHRWRTEVISSLVQEVSQAVRKANPQAKISAAVWHSPDVGLRDYAQDWVQWARDGYLDFVVPMNYTSNHRVLKEWIEGQQGLVNGRVPIYAGLGSYMLNSPQQLNRQIEVCREAGLPGYILYNYDERLKHRFLPELPN